MCNFEYVKAKPKKWQKKKHVAEGVVEKNTKVAKKGRGV